MENPIIRLPLDGAENVRDIGGYVGENKRIGKFKVFLRGDTLSNLTEEDNEFIKKYGVTDIIDLRSFETSILKKDKINRRYFKFHNIPLSNFKFKENLILEGKDFKMSEGYILVLENKKAVKKIFEVLAESKGATIIHCTVGKDRTGLIVMLILGLCGVDRKDIIADYRVTDTYVKAEIKAELVNTDLAYSLPEYIEAAIDHIEKEYKSYYEYLKSCNIDNEVLEIVKNKYLS